MATCSLMKICHTFMENNLMFDFNNCYNGEIPLLPIKR